MGDDRVWPPRPLAVPGSFNEDEKTGPTIRQRLDAIDRVIEAKKAQVAEAEARVADAEARLADAEARVAAFVAEHPGYFPDKEIAVEVVIE